MDLGIIILLIFLIATSVIRNIVEVTKTDKKLKKLEIDLQALSSKLNQYESQIQLPNPSKSKTKEKETHAS